MSDKISIKQVLRVFDVITRHGQHYDNEYHLDGLSANAGFDGYTITLHNQHSRLTVFFHNTFSFDYPNQKAYEYFLSQLNTIDKAHY